jgi:hypothetical protein
MTLEELVAEVENLAKMYVEERNAPALYIKIETVGREFYFDSQNFGGRTPEQRNRFEEIDFS